VDAGLSFLTTLAHRLATVRLIDVGSTRHCGNRVEQTAEVKWCEVSVRQRDY